MQLTEEEKKRIFLTLIEQLTAEYISCRILYDPRHSVPYVNAHERPVKKWRPVGSEGSNCCKLPSKKGLVQSQTIFHEIFPSK